MNTHDHAARPPRRAGADERLRALPDASGSSCASSPASRSASCCPAPFQAIGRMEVAQVNLPVGAADLGDDHPDAAEGRLRRAAPGAAALARHRRHAVRQLGGQAVLDGAAGLALHPPRVRALAAGRPDRQLHRRPDPAGRRALHGDGVRLEPADRRRPAVHAVAGGAQRHHHGVRLRADRRAAARALVDHRAVGHAAHLGGALHRDPGDPRAGSGARRCCARARRRSTPRWRRIGPVVDRRAAGHAGAAVRLPGRGDPRAAAGHRACWRCRS